MYNYSSLDHELDGLLQAICQELQISKSQYSEAETSYHSVSGWLASDEKRFPDIDIDIYPQGSLKIGTTVHPIMQQEFDLDFVCELNIDWEKYENATIVLDLIEERLMEHKTYAPMVERKNRCIRLNYKSNFHMDILPACPANEGSADSIKVPDSKQMTWKDSNPKGYAKWFEKKAIDFKPIFEYRDILMKSAEIEELPDIEPIEIKPPLKRAVQLIKRYRDIYFKNDSEMAPVSIVLTTIAGQLYNGQGSVNKTITEILKELTQSLNTNKEIIVINPMNEKEILSERWDDDQLLYEKFVKFINEFNIQWTNLNNIKNEGIVETSKLLKAMFGEEPINKSLIKQAKLNENYRKMNKLGITSTGLLAVSTVTGVSTEAASKEIIPVKKNTFYGD